MKFTTSITILAGASGISAAALTMEPKTLAEVVNSVTSAISNLDTAARNFNGDIAPVIEAADKVIATIHLGQTMADAIPSIDLMSAMPLLEPVKSLESHAKALLDHVRSRVHDVEKAKRCEDTRSTLSVLNSSGRNLMDTIFNKIVDVLARNLALPLMDDIKALLAQALDLFAKGHCVDAH
ncbi:Cell wall galactomannoprotein [Metarhizium rileyi]|uniref:Cell wall galactomannoprotein n=1 Tax=Metarhizium rileyi (strain RCEF 4871) TaxID=1649241 RepID=A0A167AXG6_METRR|nr:Cell wall galactomannoprotein [Metarhizium rileyi RCEF 4871]